MYSDSCLSIILYKSTRKCAAYSVHYFFIRAWGIRVITIFQTRLQSAFATQFTRSHSIILTSIIRRGEKTQNILLNTATNNIRIICLTSVFKTFSNLLQKGFSGISSIVLGENPAFTINLPKVIGVIYINGLDLFVILE